jgi:hypothetical protein
MATNAMAKKAKGKKAADPNETSKLLAAKISQLEQDAAGEKDQEAEIGASVSSIGRYVDGGYLAFIMARTQFLTFYRTRGEEGDPGFESTFEQH